MNCGDKTSDIESPVDKTLCFCAALNILDVDPDNGHVGFGGHFDNSWFRS